VVIDAGVVEKAKVFPPSRVETTETPSVALAVKSLAMPVVAPAAHAAAIVQPKVWPNRNGLGTMHASSDTDVGIPKTVKSSEPPLITTPPVRTKIVYEVVVLAGTVEKV
jgi:hypothetical protein